MPKRIPFLIVEIGLAKVYGDFSITDLDEIEGRCNLAREFVIACGWDVQTYIEKLMGISEIELPILN